MCRRGKEIKSRMKKYLFFDLDGTLTDPMEGICKSAARGLAHFGIEKDYRELTYFIGPPLMDTYRDRFGMTQEQAKEAVRVFREYFVPTGIYENKLYPGIPEMLQSLKEQGKVLCVATSKPEPMAITVLEHFGIRKYFDYVCGSTMDETRTAKSEVLAYAMKTAGAYEKQEAVMIGDRCYDAAGAAKIGIDCVGVSYGYGSHEELEKAGVIRVADSVAQLQEILTQL